MCLPFLPTNLSMNSIEELLWQHNLNPERFTVAPSTTLAAPSQTQLRHQMEEEIEQLLELRENLVEEMKSISEDFISTRTTKAEIYLDKIKDLKNVYQDKIEDFVEKYFEVLENPQVLDEWTQEVKDIANVVKRHANRIRTRAIFLGARSYEKIVTKKRFGRELTTVEMQRYEFVDEAAITKWLSNYCDEHGNIRSQPEKSNEFVSSVLHVRARAGKQQATEAVLELQSEDVQVSIVLHQAEDGDQVDTEPAQCSASVEDINYAGPGDLHHARDSMLD